jgi:hypothetical protein
MLKFYVLQGVTTKMMNHKLFLALAGMVFALALTSTQISAQTKKPNPKKPPQKAVVDNKTLELKAGAEATGAVIKKLAKFTFLLGGIAQGIEDIDAQAKLGKASRQTVEKNEQFKKSVIDGIRNLRNDLAELEVQFRVKPTLRPFNPKIDGITVLSGSAEEAALNGRFTESGKILVAVIEKLTDALSTIR